MSELYLLKHDDRLQYFNFVATEMNIPVHMIEKDYWVVWTLQRLFSVSELKDHLTFKGGTSLSKVYGLIKRFSEDIDLSIEKSFFGFTNDKSPDQASSRKQRNIILEKLSEKCSQYVQGDLLPKLKKAFSKQLGLSDLWNITVDQMDSAGQTLLFEYPLVSTDKASYIYPSIKIELGARSEHWPVSHRTIQSYAKETLKEKVDEPTVTVKVLNIERTFWEKATILHQYAHMPTDKQLPLRLSRHYYDFYCLLNSSEKSLALKNTDLLEKVAHHKDMYFPSAWAKYDQAKKGTLKLMPVAHTLSELKKDYRLMSEMFFEEPPSWEVITKAIGLCEKEFNI